MHRLLVARYRVHLAAMVVLVQEIRVLLQHLRGNRHLGRSSVNPCRQFTPRLVALRRDELINCSFLDLAEVHNLDSLCRP